MVRSVPLKPEPTPLHRGRRLWLAIWIWFALGIFSSASVGHLFYDAYLWVAGTIRVSRLNDARMTFAHFVVLYPPGQAQAAKRVGRMAEQALIRETRDMGVSPPQKIPLILFKSPSALNVSVGFPAYENNIGLYWLGTIEVLSPQNWPADAASAGQSYANAGPVPHELAHALLAFKAMGRYPDWFNEGVAQFEDWRLTGYQWLTTTNSWSHPVYSAAQLTRNFYGLPNQSMAYREGLAQVQYLVSLKGMAGYRQFLNLLSHGDGFNQALKQEYGFSNQSVLWEHWDHSRLGPQGSGHTAS